MPEPGDPWRYPGGWAGAGGGRYRAPVPFDAPVEPDTSYLCVVDEWGNAFSATPSDGGGASPIIPGLGFIVSGRGIQSWLDPEHPSAIAPGKRPRLTPNPGLIMRDGQVFAPYGTPGTRRAAAGDGPARRQPDRLRHGAAGGDRGAARRELQLPGLVAPAPLSPGLVRAEGRLAAGVLADLARRGHQVEPWADWAAQAGALCTTVVTTSAAS